MKIRFDFEDISSCKIGIVGCGYVGLPLFVAFSKVGEDVVAFDIDETRVNELRSGTDRNGELSCEEIEALSGRFESSLDALADRNVFIITVPTPVDVSSKPDLTSLVLATRQVAEIIKEGACIVYESTVYPGCIREICLPLIEEVSGLKVGQDFFLGFSPERINPGDKQHTLANIVKVVSGINEDSLKKIANLYRLIVREVYCAPSIEVAEAAKLLENIQRDVNIALMNESWSCFSKMNIPMEEVLRVASTKWNFINFHPGLVGGHCIPVDPYYLIEKAEQNGIDLPLIKQARITNEKIVNTLGQKVVQSLKLPLTGKRVLIRGLAFKYGVADLRNTKIPKLKKILEGNGIKVDVCDPVVSVEEAKKVFGVDLLKEDEVNTGDYDLIISPYDFLVVQNS